MPSGDYSFYLIIVFVLAVIGFSIFRAQQRKQRFAALAEELGAQAQGRGWTFRTDPTVRGNAARLMFDGRNGGIEWHIESYGDRVTGPSDSDSREYTRWWTESKRLDGGVVLLYPKLPHTIQLGPLAAKSGSTNPAVRFVLNTFIKNVLHGQPDDARELEYLAEVQAGSDRLREHFVIMATGESLASDFLDQDAEAILLEWEEGDSLHIEAGIGAIVFWKRGVQITFDRQIYDLDQLGNVVKIGVALASGQ